MADIAASIAYTQRAETGVGAPIPALTTPHLYRRRDMADSTQPPNPSTRKPLTAERLREILHYDPATGIFTARIGRSNVRAGDVVGGPMGQGYLMIGVDYGKYLAHRLAWLYMTGEWPSDRIDHRNTVRHDNRWRNLRQATHTQNMHNAGLRRNNTSGAKCVVFCRTTQRWRVQIWANGAAHHIGRFDTVEEASLAYQAAVARLHGEFARVA